MDDKMIEVLSEFRSNFAATCCFFYARTRDHEKNGDHNPFDEFYDHFLSVLYGCFVHAFNHDLDLYDRMQSLSNGGQISSLVDNLPTGSKIENREE